MYKEFFKFIADHAKERNLEFKAEVLHSDFEMAVINNLKKWFPKARVVGCYFHYTQAIIKKLQRLGLIVLYKTHQKFSKLYFRV